MDGLETYEIPGGHDTMKEEPNVAILAQKLGACLDRARELTEMHNNYLS